MLLSSCPAPIVHIRYGLKRWQYDSSIRSRCSKASLARLSQSFVCPMYLLFGPWRMGMQLLSTAICVSVLHAMICDVSLLRWISHCLPCPSCSLQNIDAVATCWDNAFRHLDPIHSGTVQVLLILLRIRRLICVWVGCGRWSYIYGVYQVKSHTGAFANIVLSCILLRSDSDLLPLHRASLCIQFPSYPPLPPPPRLSSLAPSSRGFDPR